jgi:MoxR-like ATPase
MLEVVPDLGNKTKKPAPAPIMLGMAVGRAPARPELGANGVQDNAPKDAEIDVDHPANYDPDDGLVNAIRAALLLRRPLLLTGEPGTGKTQAAHYLNWKMGFGKKALRFDSKSTSVARDLFYTFNTLGHFYAAQTQKGSQKSVDYIRYNALGEAILRANQIGAIMREDPQVSIRDLLPETFTHPGEPVQSVVLIDEIDKAPRDFPNDLLGELEHMRFLIAELDNIEVQAAAKYKPVTVITSNSEKNLPAAFLRRCVYYHIKKPDKTRFAAIVKAQLGWNPSSALANDALDFLVYLREKLRDLQKKPATAELLDWLLVLDAHGAQPDQRFREIRPTVESTLGALIKDEGRDASAILSNWLAL